jgi:hypothetical protein
MNVFRVSVLNTISKGREQSIMKKGFIKWLAVMGAAIMLMMTSGAVYSPAFAVSDKRVDADSTWVVNETTNLAGLTIGRRASITAPKGYSVTLTVDGIGTPVKYGSYKGKIVLTVTKDIMMDGRGGSPGGFLTGAGASGGAPAGGGAPAAGGAAPSGGGGPGRSSKPFRAAVYIENGKYIAEKSVAAAVTGGKVTDSSAKDVKITSNEGYFNGIIITGDSKSTYSIINPVINLTENGGDDFSGLGAAITINGKAEVTIDNASIRGAGYNRSAIIASGESIVHVNNSDIEVDSGILNEDPVATLGIDNKTMLVGPWLMGMYGRNRATNVMQSATIYYNNCHIKSNQWGALSTDGPKKIRLFATKCLIENVDTGYGSYSIGDSINTFSGCTFNVVDYGLILCNMGSGILTDGCVVNSKKIGVMMHDGTGGSNLTIDKGTVVNTKSTVIQIKGSRGANIVVDSAQLNTEKGIILQTMPNDDPDMQDKNIITGNEGTTRDVNAVFSNMAMNGDIINGFTASGSVNVTFKNAVITGAITTATTDHPLMKNETITRETPEFYYFIGEVNNIFGAKPEDTHGVAVSLDAGSKWIVDRTSYITSLTIDKSAGVTAPEGYSVTMTVNGVTTPVKAGDYKGQIVLKVAKNV